jgi:hypothetical protein
MITNDPYITEPDARADLMTRLVNRLHLDGEWDGALALLGGAGSADTRDGTDGGTDGGADDSAAAIRARILVDRYWWRLDDPAPAEQAVAGLGQPALRGYLAAQLAYTRILFGLGPRPDDEQVVHAGLQEAARDEALRGWVAFWQGVVADNVRHDPDTAQQRYGEALARCRDGDDLLLESYVVRHQGGHLIESDRPAGEMLLRRSLYLRSALGARPQTAAAQATLAGELPPGQERDILVRAARSTAAELGLSWLVKQFAETS